MPPKPLGIQLYTVRDVIRDNPPHKTLEEIAAIGYSGIEGSGFGLSPQEFRALTRDLGLTHTSHFGAIPNAQNVAEIIETAQALEVQDVVASLWIPHLVSRDAIRKSANDLADPVEQIRRAGLNFHFHNHWMEFDRIDERFALDWLLDDLPAAQVELDIYWSGNFGQNAPPEMVARYRDRVTLMHVKDGPQTKDAPMTAVGEGTVDVDACIQAADPDRLKWLIVELDHHDGDMMQAVRRSHDYLVGQGLALGRATT